MKKLLIALIAIVALYLALQDNTPRPVTTLANPNNNQMERKTPNN